MRTRLSKEKGRKGKKGRGHTVRLIPPAYVKPYVKRQKNDAADAEAICEAVTRPNMRFVPIKTISAYHPFATGLRTLPSVGLGSRGRICRLAVTLRRPVDRKHASENQHHSDFRFDVWQEVGKPPGRVGLPINERRIAGREISVKPQGYPHQFDDPTNNNCFAHALIRSPWMCCRLLKQPPEGRGIFN
jgi:hypothetical protein